MSAHTPGPWFFNDGEGGRYFPHVVVGGDDPSARWCLVINTCRGKNGGELSELVANARLIAAAPEMLEALKAVVEQFVGVDHHRDDCPGLLAHDGVTVLGPVCRDHQVAALVDSAIAKATGGES